MNLYLNIQPILEDFYSSLALHERNKAVTYYEMNFNKFNYYKRETHEIWHESYI